MTDYASVTGLATALRIGLINAAKEKALSANQDTVKDVIYRYVTGQEFNMQVRAIANAFGRMKEELDKEKQPPPPSGTPPWQGESFFEEPRKGSHRPGG